MKAKDFKELIKGIPNDRDILFMDYLDDKIFHLMDDPEKVLNIGATALIKIEQSKPFGILPCKAKDFRGLIESIPNDTNILFSDYPNQETYHLSNDLEKVLNEGFNALLKIERSRSLRTMLPRYQDAMWDGTP